MLRRCVVYAVSVGAASALLLGACAGPAATPVHVLDTGVQPVIIDTDLDLSDIAAVAALAHDPRVEVRAITLTPNGTGPWDCPSLSRLAAWVLDGLGVTDVPVACGEKRKSEGALDFPADWHAGADRLWGLALPEGAGTPPETSVTGLLSTATADGPVLLVALGPWTNIADALTADPGLASRLTAIHAMAGVVEADGNVQVGSVVHGDRLEWNAVLDPVAFRAVLATDVPVRLVPLDATDDVPVPGDLTERLAAEQGRGAALVADLLRRAPERLTGEGQQLWDELAALAVTRDDVVTWEEKRLVVATDTRLDESDSGRPVTVAVEGHPDAAADALVAALR